MLFVGILSTGLVYPYNTFAQNKDTLHIISEAADFPIHTTIYHNYHGKTLTFQVTFDIGYYNVKTKSCMMQKRRNFQATHKDGSHALLYGKHLANEYAHGPKLYDCVHETLHVICSQYPDESMTYQLKNNGTYYTRAIPNVHNVYPR